MALKLDVDAPYLAIYRALETPSSIGAGVLGITKVRGHVFADGVSLLDCMPVLALTGKIFGGSAVDFPDIVRPPPSLFH
jgi:hypothetical protein